MSSITDLGTKLHMQQNRGLFWFLCFFFNPGKGFDQCPAVDKMTECHVHYLYESSHLCPHLGW